MHQLSLFYAFYNAHKEKYWTVSHLETCIKSLFCVLFGVFPCFECVFEHTFYFMLNWTIRNLNVYT